MKTDYRLFRRTSARIRAILLALVSVALPSAASAQQHFRDARKMLQESLTAPSLCSDQGLHDVRVTNDAVQLSGVLEPAGTVNPFVNFYGKSFENLSLKILFSDYKGYFFRKSYRGNMFNPADSDVHSCGDQTFYRVTIELNSKAPARFISIRWLSEEDAAKFLNALHWLRANATSAQAQEQEAQKQFEKSASEWRSAVVKPSMPEAAHQHEVLAENAVRKKNLDKAVNEYEAALEVFPTWPEGQFNVAQICGETGDYDCAVQHMQDYVALMPNAPDAQAANDQLIIWRDKLGLSQTPAASSQVATQKQR